MKLIDRVKTAEMLGKKPSYVSWLVQRRLLGFYRIGQQLRFSVSEVEDYLKRCRVPALAERARAVRRSSRAPDIDLRRQRRAGGVK